MTDEYVYQVTLTMGSSHDRDLLINLLNDWEVGGIEGFDEPVYSFSTQFLPAIGLGDYLLEKGRIQ